MAVRMAHVALLRQELAHETVDWHEERRRRRAWRMAGELVTVTGAAEAPRGR
jgi:hypothetical protein